MTWETLQELVGLGESQINWVTKIFLIVSATLILNFLISRLFIRIDKQLDRTSTYWDNAILNAAHKPVTSGIWLIGFALAFEISEKELAPQMVTAIDNIRQVGVIALITWFVTRLVKNSEHILVSAEKMKQPMDLTTASAISKLLRASIVITSLLVILQTLGYSVSGVLAFGGVGGIAVGFAAKDLLANFFGGLMVYLDRPFSVGDWVRSPDKEIEGTVENIGWRQTRIRTFDKRPLYVPNSTFSVISVENPSRMTHRRIYETIGVRYDDASQLADIISKVKTMLKEHDEIDSTQTLIVNFNKFGASSLDFFIYTFTKTVNWVHYHEVKQDVLLRVMKIITDSGAEIAFPTQTLHIAAHEETLNTQVNAPQITPPQP
ncbi:mechanosensitive ion channel family protein [Marinomonas sp. 15G1-11]|uniref:Mechanosensitive ion channel family protein n=1 Tax=Marinomonas phaeophyticola TaxID=3004091 RepID=A0ABT4JUA9_9GAMM|nr:mechanosensitive ion channel family protein [Marinomonas sp. 15G1-11]MCZ2721169.1 mechanosensitive ion channel family protein [Marinomonas sp. 15G1-11]